MTEIELKLHPIDGKDLKEYKHVQVYACQDVNLWYLRFSRGNVPETLRQKFTNYNQFMKYVTSYFKGKNIDIIE